MRRSLLAGWVVVAAACTGRMVSETASSPEDGAGDAAPLVDAARPTVVADAGAEAERWRPLVGEVDPEFTIQSVGYGETFLCRGASSVLGRLDVADDDSIRVALLSDGAQAQPGQCWRHYSANGAPLGAGHAGSVGGVAALAGGRTAVAEGTSWGATKTLVHVYDDAGGLSTSSTIDAGGGTLIHARGSRLLRESSGSLLFVDNFLARVREGQDATGVKPLFDAISEGIDRDATDRIFVLSRVGGTVGVIAYRSDNLAADSTFADAGMVELDIALDPGRRRGTTTAIAIAPDRHIYVVSTVPTPRVYRLLESGTPDTTFGTDGMTVVTELATAGATSYPPPTLAVEADGRVIVFVGAAVRLSLDGRVDTSFGAHGVLNVAAHWGAAFQADGRLVVFDNTRLFRIR